MTSSFEVRYSELALEDIRGILQHSLEYWGSHQQDDYATAIDQAIELLTRFPYSGTKMDAPFEDFRKRIVKEHLIIYQIADSTLIIYRVIHKRRDIARLEFI